MRAAARASRAKCCGAFEVINKLEGDFTDEDEAALVELAAHAAIALENTQECEQLLDPATGKSSIKRPRACNWSAAAR